MTKIDLESLRMIVKIDVDRNLYKHLPIAFQSLDLLCGQKLPRFYKRKRWNIILSYYNRIVPLSEGCGQKQLNFIFSIVAAYPED